MALNILKYNSNLQKPGTQNSYLFLIYITENPKIEISLVSLSSFAEQSQTRGY